MEQNVSPVKDKIEVVFEFEPHQKVYIKALDCTGRIERCVWDGSNMYYSLYYFLNGDQKYLTLCGDELDGEC